MSIYQAWVAQIALLVVKKVFVLNKYLDLANIFLRKSAMELLKRCDINKYSINLKPSMQPSYDPIYRLGPVELKTLKTYIENNLANNFIQQFKSFVEALILFI